MARTTNDDSTKRAALKLLAHGLITRAEAARLAGASHQLVSHWAREMDLEGAREAVLQRLWERETRR